MISHDFIMLEMYYGPAEAAQYIEDVVKKYGQASVDYAVKKGLLEKRTVCFGPDKGRTLCYLSRTERIGVLDKVF